MNDTEKRPDVDAQYEEEQDHPKWALEVQTEGLDDQELTAEDLEAEA